MGLYDRNYYHEGEESRFDGGYSKRSAVVTIVIINVIIFFADAFTHSTERVVVRSDGNATVNVVADNDNDGMIQVRKVSGGAIMKFLAVKDDLFQKPWNFWQLLTYGFAHSPIGTELSIWHLVFNMVTLFFLGSAVEQKYGKTEFVKFYLMAIIFAGFCWVLSNAIKPQPALCWGASGGVAAVVILLVLNFPQQNLMLFGIVPIRAWILGVVMILLDFLRAFDPDTSIGWETHLGGAAFAAMYFFRRWNFKWLKLEAIPNLFGGKGPRLKVHDPDAKRRQLRREGDRILEKVHAEGENSLTRKERKTLERYSKEIRTKRDTDF